MCDSESAVCADPAGWLDVWYVGHDEPSLEFKSSQPGTGNDMTYVVTLPKDPRVQPNATGVGGTTWNFELRPTFWFGMTLCDSESAPDSSLVQIDGCFFDNEDWDGQSYRFDWPGTNPNPVVDQALHPTPVLFTSPAQSGRCSAGSATAIPGARTRPGSRCKHWGVSAEPQPELTYAIVDASEARSPQLREQLLDMWVDVTNAGGAVGFTVPADVSAVARTLDAALDRVAAGTDLLAILRQNGTAVGMGFLVDGGSPLRRHWRTILRLMVRPELQGRGAGRLLLEGLHGTAVDLGLEQLMLTTRGGTGVEGFYERCGYTVVGKHPGAIRLAPGDDRDELFLIFRL